MPKEVLNDTDLPETEFVLDTDQVTIFAIQKLLERNGSNLSVSFNLNNVDWFIGQLDRYTKNTLEEDEQKLSRQDVLDLVFYGLKDPELEASSKETISFLNKINSRQNTINQYFDHNHPDYKGKSVDLETIEKELLEKRQNDQYDAKHLDAATSEFLSTLSAAFGFCGTLAGLITSITVTPVIGVPILLPSLFLAKKAVDLSTSEKNGHDASRQFHGKVKAQNKRNRKKDKQFAKDNVASERLERIEKNEKSTAQTLEVLADEFETYANNSIRTFDVGTAKKHARLYRMDVRP